MLPKLEQGDIVVAWGIIDSAEYRHGFNSFSLSSVPLYLEHWDDLFDSIIKKISVKLEDTEPLTSSDMHDLLIDICLNLDLDNICYDYDPEDDETFEYPDSDERFGVSYFEMNETDYKIACSELEKVIPKIESGIISSWKSVFRHF